jgi:hypothetical protein
MSQPAFAQTEASYGLNFYRLQCITETGKTRLGSDEPYVLILTADLSTGEIKQRQTQVFKDVLVILSFIGRGKKQEVA